jgi:Protein of unknown function (DUF2490)
MSHVRNLWVTLILLVLVVGFDASAQVVDEGLPEIDLYYKLKSDVRIWFQVKETREGGDPTTAEIGPSLDFYLKPWLKLKDITAFDLDDSMGRPLIVSIGYRYLPYPNAPPDNRLEPFFTFNLPMAGGLLLSDRNRADLDWLSGTFSWEYRNRVQLQRTVRISSYHPTPYASAEFFYQSKYAKWSDTAIYAGCLFPIGKHVQFNPYYEHQNQTGKSPNQQLNQLGLMLNLYF